MRHVIYTITSPDGRAYVGATSNFKARRHNHRRQLRKGRGVNKALQSAWNAYGELPFSQVASVLRREDLHVVEDQVISQLDSPMNQSRPSPLPTAATTTVKPVDGFASIADAADAFGISYKCAKYYVRKYGSVEIGQLLTKTKVLLSTRLSYLGHDIVSLCARLVRSKDIGAAFGMNEIRFTYNGQTKNLMQWCRDTGVRYGTALARKADGWPLEQAVGLVPRQKQKRRPSANRRFIEVDGVRRSINDWAAHLGVRPGVIHARLHMGWSEERAVTTPKR